jgi:hypothetical protein
MVRRHKIGVDVDEVITNFVSAFRQEAQQVMGRDFPEKSVSWGFEDWGLSKADVDKIWGEINRTYNWFSMFDNEPLPTVAYTLPFLTLDHEVYFITARRDTRGDPVQVQTQDTLMSLGVVCPTVIVTDVKGPIVAALELEAFVDDKPSNLENIALHSPNTKLFLMEQTQTLNYKAPASWTRVRNLEDFAKKL